MTNKHYVVLPDTSAPDVFRVVCLPHDVADQLKLIEAEALANALNLKSCRCILSIQKVY